jgi:two-component system LytT family sensor kinase
MKIQKALSVFLPRNRFERHTFSWIVFIFANAGLYSMGLQKDRFVEYLADYILSLPIIFLITYLTIYWLIPQLLLRKKVALFLFLFLVLLFISGILELLKTKVILLPLINPENIPDYSIDIYSISRGAFFILIPAIYFITIKYAREWYHMRVLKTEEERKQLRNELKFLKAQVHPHFLLVTLSNLENIAKENPVKAAPGIEKISEILNFILYECNVPQIRLNKELEQVRRFIELQELNFATKPEINYSIIGPTIEVRIAPLMIFTIVEFFFKNAGNTQDNGLKMNLFLEIFNNILNFTVDSENFDISETVFNEDSGIHNLKKRIDLLYHDKADLTFRYFANKSMVQFNLKYD